MDEDGYYDFILNATGLAAISKTGITKIGLRESAYDAPNIAPPWVSGHGRTLYIRYADDGSYKPKLVITYDLELPTVVTDPATEIT